MSRETYFAFSIANVRFLARNAFDRPDPGSFAILPTQMEWIRGELEAPMKKQ